jgi:rhodanese-related sulfurtransferase
MTVENISPVTLKKWLEAGKAVVVDVREHIEGASLVPLGRIRRAALPEHTGRKLVIMCRMGGRGQAACQRLRAEMSAHETIYHLEGGILGWKRAGLPVEKTERRAAPYEPAQVHSSGWGGLFRRFFARQP